MNCGTRRKKGCLPCRALLDASTFKLRGDAKHGKCIVIYSNTHSKYGCTVVLTHDAMYSERLRPAPTRKLSAAPLARRPRRSSGRSRTYCGRAVKNERAN